MKEFRNRNSDEFHEKLHELMEQNTVVKRKIIGMEATLYDTYPKKEGVIQ